MRLEGKVALISGGAQGQGAAEAKLFAREGAKVVIGDVLEEDGRKTEAEINEAGGEALFIRLDVSKASEWRRAIDATVAKFGKLDVLVNNAAIYEPLGRTEDITEEEWDRYVAVNATGPFLGCKYAIPEMRRAGGGSIVNIGSDSGILGGRGPIPYAASKGALRAFTNAAAVEYASEGIRINSIHPGPPYAEGSALNGTGRGPLETSEWIKRNVPMERIGDPLEIARAVLFMASDESSFVTGAELSVDGGSLMGAGGETGQE